MTARWWRVAVIVSFVCAGFAVRAAETVQSSGEDGNFSAKSRQADLASLRDFVYPKGFSDEAIVELENGNVPDDIAISDYARLHCGETSRFVLYPCIIRYPDGGRVAYYVVAQDANMRFTDFESAAAYYRERITDATSQLSMEVDVLNMFVDDFCAQIAAGARATDILRARNGDLPRIFHPIGTPDPGAKYQFSNLFSWSKCAQCVGIVAVNQPDAPPAPTCGALRKQSLPHLAYFVVDRNTSKGHRSLDESIGDFAALAKTATP
jgi:hypothetical protein